jgi:hypothetical protein
MGPLVLLPGSCRVGRRSHINRRGFTTGRGVNGPVSSRAEKGHDCHLNCFLDKEFQQYKLSIRIWKKFVNIRSRFILGFSASVNKKLGVCQENSKG